MGLADTDGPRPEKEKTLKANRDRARLLPNYARGKRPLVGGRLGKRGEKGNLPV